MWILLGACASGSESFTISPEPVAFGEIDFAQRRPEEGFNPIAVTLTNTGESDVPLRLAAFDDSGICVEGYSHDLLPAVLGTVAPGSPFVLTLSICGCVQGGCEEGVEASTEVTISTDGSDFVQEYPDGAPGAFTIPITYTPVWNYPDTAR